MANKFLTNPFRGKVVFSTYSAGINGSLHTEQVQGSLSHLIFKFNSKQDKDQKIEGNYEENRGVSKSSHFLKTHTCSGQWKAALFYKR